MTNTYSYGKRKRTGHPVGHCFCRYDFGRKARLRKEHNNFMKFHILPFVEDYLS